MEESIILVEKTVVRIVREDTSFAFTRPDCGEYSKDVFVVVLMQDAYGDIRADLWSKEKFINNRFPDWVFDSVQRILITKNE